MNNTQGEPQVLGWFQAVAQGGRYHHYNTQQESSCQQWKLPVALNPERFSSEAPSSYVCKECLKAVKGQAR